MSATAIHSFALMRDAAIEVYRRRRVLYPAIILPIVGLLLLSWLPHAYYATSTISIIVVGLAGLPFYVVLATTCHRVILLGEDSLPNRFGVFWSKRETLFLGQLLILGLIAAAIAVPIWALVSILAISGFADFDRETIIATVYGVSILSTYVDGRFGLILPATAIGERTSLGRSWRMSRGAGWRIAIALLIPSFSLKLIEYVIFDFLIETDSPFIGFLWGLTTFPLFAFFVAIITVAYRHLSIPTDRE